MTEAPEPGDVLKAARPSPETLDLMRMRRSGAAKLMTEPGPSPSELNDLLLIAARVPDHRKLVPFRFVVFEGEARAAFAPHLERAARARDPDAKESKIAEEAMMLARAPVVVTVVSSVNPEHKTPVFEQELTCGAVCQNLLIAACAAGYAGQWLTGWPAYDDGVAAALGLRENERVAGFLYLGTPLEDPKERPRPKAGDVIARWTP